MVYAKQHAEFLTVTCLEWKHVLREDRFKDVITGSLLFLTMVNRVSVYVFVIMPNHFHLIWQVMADHQRKRLGIFIALCWVSSTCVAVCLLVYNSIYLNFCNITLYYFNHHTLCGLTNFSPLILVKSFSLAVMMV